MISRVLAAVTVAFALVFFVFFCQSSLGRICTDLAEKADRAGEVLSSESTLKEGMELLEELSREFEQHRPFLGVFVNDGQIHEIQRALSRAKQLGEEGDVSPVLEALADLSKTLKELSETHRPTWENIL